MKAFKPGTVVTAGLVAGLLVAGCSSTKSGPGGPCHTPNDCVAANYCIADKCVPVGQTTGLLPDGGIPQSGEGGCMNYGCLQVSCADGGRTTVTGQVLDPSGTVPLYNAIVYVPNGQVQPLSSGASCDRCGAIQSGFPLVTTLTNSAGAFKLSNVPAAVSFPLVMQVGKWRRQVTIPAVPACTSQPMTDVSQQRLPRNKAEGDIPQFAIATGTADPFQCLLLKMGMDPAEFTEPNNNGRVHMYVTPYVSSTTGPPMRLSPSTPPDTSLWLDAGTLARYDVVLLPCEGGEFRKPDAGVVNLTNYTNSGGRLFTTHYGYVWTAFAQPFMSTADWSPDPTQVNDPPPLFYVLADTGTPKGEAFSEWLGNVNALDGGYLPLEEARQDLNGIHTDAGTTSWLVGNNPTDTAHPRDVQHLTFNTPINPKRQSDGGEGIQCGRVVFSDFHVTAGALADTNGNFPSSCKLGPMTPQEKALVFMLFDVSSCIQDDSKPPAVCPGIGEACSTTQPCCSGYACVDPNFNPCRGDSCVCSPIVN